MDDEYIKQQEMGEDYKRMVMQYICEILEVDEQYITDELGPDFIKPDAGITDYEALDYALDLIQAIPASWLLDVLDVLVARAGLPDYTVERHYHKTLQHPDALADQIVEGLVKKQEAGDEH